MPSCPCGECESYAAHMRSINAAPRMGDVGRWRQRDVALEYDRVAYREMKRQGLQPPQLRGAYDLARRATSEAEIRLGQVVDERDAARKRKGTALMEATLEIADHGMTGKMPTKGGKKRKKIKR